MNIQNIIKMKRSLLTTIFCLVSLSAMTQVYKAAKQLSPGTTNEHYLAFAKSVKGKFYYMDQNCNP
jgi:hypothetical protein